jgi:hypothetical protein
MQYPAWINNWKKRHTFKLEISLVLLVKALLLMGIWYFFFSDPLGDHLNDRLMTDHFMPSEQHAQQNQ